MKGVRISDEAKEHALDLYKAGYSYEAIHQKTGVSEASMTGIVAERAEGDPDLNSIHDLAKWCREHRRTPESLIRGVTTEEKIIAAGSTVDEVDGVVLPFIKRHGKNSAEVARQGEAYHKIVVATGFTYPQLVHEQTRISKELEYAAEENKKVRAENVILTGKIGEMTSELRHLQDLKTIKDSLSRMHKRPKDAAPTFQRAEALFEKDVTAESLDRLATEFDRRGMNGADAPAEVAELVKQHGSLKTAVKSEAEKLTENRRENARLNRTLPILRQRELQRKAACREVGEVLGKLQTRYDSLDREFIDREKTLVANAEERVRETYAEGEGKYETHRELWSRSISAQRERAVQLTKTNDRLEAETVAKVGRITAAEAMWGFVLEKKPIYFNQISRYYSGGGSYAGLPLPEPVRDVLASALKSLALTDALVRLEQTEKKRRETEKSTETILRDAYAAFRASETTVRLFKRVAGVLPCGDDVVQRATQELLKEPAFVWKVLVEADNDFLIRVLLEGNEIGRNRIRSLVDSANRRANEEFNRNFKNYLHAMMAKAEAELKAQILADMRKTFPFAPPPLFYGQVEPKTIPTREVSPGRFVPEGRRNKPL